MEGHEADKSHAKKELAHTAGQSTPNHHTYRTISLEYTVILLYVNHLKNLPNRLTYIYLRFVIVELNLTP